MEKDTADLDDTQEMSTAFMPSLEFMLKALGQFKDTDLASASDEQLRKLIDYIVKIDLYHFDDTADWIDRELCRQCNIISDELEYRASKQRMAIMMRHARAVEFNTSDGGFVYLLQGPNAKGYGRSGGLIYKIGKTKEPWNRLKTFGVQLPFDVEFVTLIPSERPYQLEKRYHEAYGKYRIGGEWFMLPLDIVLAMAAKGLSKHE